jgi:hypothetical protein
MKTSFTEKEFQKQGRPIYGRERPGESKRNDCAAREYIGFQHLNESSLWNMTRIFAGNSAGEPKKRRSFYFFLRAFAHVRGELFAARFNQSTHFSSK